MIHRERFPRHRLERKPLVSDPRMHHDTCVTHMPWRMSGSLTRGGGENVPGIPGVCTTAFLRTCWEGHGPVSIHTNVKIVSSQYRKSPGGDNNLIYNSMSYIGKTALLSWRCRLRNGGHFVSCLYMLKTRNSSVARLYILRKHSTLATLHRHTHNGINAKLSIFIYNRFQLRVLRRS